MPGTLGQWAAAMMLSLAVDVAPATAQLAKLPPDVRSQIAALGPNLTPAVITKSFALMRPLEASRAGLAVTKDVSFGPDPLQKLDLYRPKGAQAAPIVVFVHGGGFVRGDKSDYDNVPAYFARHGMLGDSST